MKFITYYCFLILIILIFSYVNSLHNVEQFTPQIRQLYRPYIRNVRIFGEEFYTKFKTYINNFLRKLEII